MALTQNRRRSRLSLRRHRPRLEHLDERCLLSTGAGPACLIRLPFIFTRPLFELTFQPDNRFLIGRFPVNTIRSPRAYNPARDKARAAGRDSHDGNPDRLDPIIGAAAARHVYGVYGTGFTVAVIDTGIDYNNPALGGGFGPNAKVIAGYDFASNSPDPMATASQHGTAVAGLIGSSDPQSPGVAPGVKIVGLRITGSDNTASSATSPGPSSGSSTTMPSTTSRSSTSR